MKSKFIGIFRYISKNPFTFPFRLIISLICRVRSWYYSLYIDGGNGRIIITKPFVKFKIKKDKTANLFIKGLFRVIPHISGKTISVIDMAANSKLEINGDFSIGNGVKFMLASNSSLVIGGKDKESDSGITANTMIMVYKNINIGKDFLCAWNVFISDSDWHSIDGQNHQADVSIADHTWVANNSSILKGSQIEENSIIASYTKVINKKYPKNSMIAGTPARVVKTDINWSRDIVSNS
ncbi:hypothetical protein Q4Q35_15045 [Flavivirga aquimarina]|uniref:Acetyltransferase n=1 Tax=Flavivirga aquimarina TaxID=2027862 RepID=A0ABT8WDI3_9FLAO|nr:hypothetical protein [Flavivirga aquimarina]MDO5971123.1 hypothetical protein [Flavivirga aquimarina]